MESKAENTASGEAIKAFGFFARFPDFQTTGLLRSDCYWDGMQSKSRFIEFVGFKEFFSADPLLNTMLFILWLLMLAYWVKYVLLGG